MSDAPCRTGHLIHQKRSKIAECSPCRQDAGVPAGFTGDRLPVGISFLGREFSEGRLLALGYAFEQATRVRRDPVHAPALEKETIRR